MNGTDGRTTGRKRRNLYTKGRDLAFIPPTYSRAYHLAETYAAYLLVGTMSCRDRLLQSPAATVYRRGVAISVESHCPRTTVSGVSGPRVLVLQFSLLPMKGLFGGSRCTTLPSTCWTVDWGQVRPGLSHFFLQPYGTLTACAWRASSRRRLRLCVTVDVVGQRRCHVLTKASGRSAVPG